MSFIPPGTEGKDWAEEHFSIQGDKTIVRVTATNNTVNAQSGNSSRIVIYLNDVAKRDRMVEAAKVADSLDVKGPGEYHVVAVGYNGRADADSVTINLEEIKPKVFGS